MAEPALKRMTFEDFTRVNGEGRCELVNGQLEELVAPRPRHGWTGGRIFAALDLYLDEHEPDAYWGVELDIPTLPFFGRRPDFAYYSASAAAQFVDLEADTVTGVPTLVVEVLSAEDERRDLVTKRREYAQVGIPHYWILDPRTKTVTTLRLQAGVYQDERQWPSGEVLTSDLFPGWEVPVSRLFRARRPGR